MEQINWQTGEAITSRRWDMARWWRLGLIALRWHTRTWENHVFVWFCYVPWQDIFIWNLWWKETSELSLFLVTGVNDFHAYITVLEMVNYRSAPYSPTIPHDREGKFPFSRWWRNSTTASFSAIFFCLANRCEYISLLQQQDQNVFQLGNHAHFISVLSFSCSAGSRALTAIYISSHHWLIPFTRLTPLSQNNGGIL